MTLTFLDFATTARISGAAFRRQRPGPERELVQEFLAGFQFDVPQGCHATVFCEPRIESGFPDIVVVLWSIATAKKWTSDRSKLTRYDMQLVHYLFQVGHCSFAQLRAIFARGLRASLDRLEAAHLIRGVQDSWIPRPLSDVFATRRIIAIEAKVTAWSDAIDQAFLNRWFASDSFVLLPDRKRSEKISAIAKSKGVRLCFPKQSIICGRSAFPEKLPLSYASWLFNEWAWRFAQLGGGIHS